MEQVERRRIFSFYDKYRTSTNAFTFKKIKNKNNKVLFTMEIHFLLKPGLWLLSLAIILEQTVDVD